MRVLLTTRGSSGHLGPLAPFGHAARRAGHEVLAAAQPQHAGNVERAGLPFAPLADPPPESWRPLLAEFGRQDMATAHARMVGAFFAGIDTRAALPHLQALIDDWRPDVIVRESWEFASALVAEQRGIPLARVGLGLAGLEEQTIALAAGTIDEQRAALDLPPDPAGDRLRETPYLTTVPAGLDGAEAAAHRFAHPRTEAEAPLQPRWWPADRQDQLVYLSFGSVTAAEHLPFFPALYRAAIDALARLPVRVLLTVGEDRDHAELGPLPPNVHVERWVAQDAVLPHVDVAVSHGGYGSTLGALRHGVPLVLVPLFSGDQFVNATAVARAGAGLALDDDAVGRGALELPAPGTLGRLGDAVELLLGDPAYRDAAAGIAAEMRALPPVDAAVDLFVEMAR